MTKKKQITIKMPKKMLKAWINDLETIDQKKQGRNLLESHGRYCCLGRLQKVIDGKVQRVVNGTAFGLPTKNWLDKNKIDFGTGGLEDNNPYLPSLNCTASQANDGNNDENKKYTFKEIASAIRKCSKGV